MTVTWSETPEEPDGPAFEDGWAVFYHGEIVDTGLSLHRDAAESFADWADEHVAETGERPLMASIALLETCQACNGTTGIAGYGDEDVQCDQCDLGYVFFYRSIAV